MQLQININDKEPLYIQIYNDIKQKIQLGQFTSNTKLPSQRVLATLLNVSRNTVDLAYNQLLSEGYVYSKPKSGYYVSALAELPFIALPKESKPPIVTPKKAKEEIDFSPFAIDTSNFPYHTWKKLSKEVMNEYNNDLFLLGENQGDYALRNAIHRYLTNFRFVNCSKHHIIIGAGSDYLLQLLSQILRIHLDDTPHVGMENPTYMRAYHIFKGFAYNISPIPIDKHGINMNSLIHCNCNLTYVTPSHQYPTGVVMSINRRYELLNWANESKKRYVIEDDHDSEFRFKGKPIPSLQSIDTSNRVIYLGTFSRSLTPALRVAYMVLPEELYQVYQRDFFYYSCTVSRIDQGILSEFLLGGYFERHLNKMRKLYKTKHDHLLIALNQFGSHIIIRGENAGLHLVVTFLVEMKEEELISLAKQSNIKLYGIHNHYLSQKIGTNPVNMSLHPFLNKENVFKSKEIYPTILLGYGNITLDEITAGIHKLYHLLKDKLNT